MMRSAVCLLLLAGCAGLSMDEGPFVAEDPSLGVVIEIRAERQGNGIHLEGEARNEGARSLEYALGCDHTWSVVLLDAGGERVPHDESVATCMGYRHVDFLPGDKVSFGFEWDGRIHDGRVRNAPPGPYTWQIGFFVWDPDTQQRGMAIEVPFRVW